MLKKCGVFFKENNFQREVEFLWHQNFMTTWTVCIATTDENMRCVKHCEHGCPKLIGDLCRCIFQSRLNWLLKTDNLKVSCFRADAKYPYTYM